MATSPAGNTAGGAMATSPAGNTAVNVTETVAGGAGDTAPSQADVAAMATSPATPPTGSTAGGATATSPITSPAGSNAGGAMATSPAISPAESQLALIPNVSQSPMQVVATLKSKKDSLEAEVKALKDQQTTLLQRSK